MGNQSSKKMIPKLFSEEERIQIVISYWIRMFNIKLGWINDFDKLVVNYLLCLTSFFQYLNHTQFSTDTTILLGIDYAIFDDIQFICSGSQDTKVSVWNIDKNRQIQVFEKHSGCVNCVKFSSYHYHNNHRSVICSSSQDKTIRFWDFKDNQELQLFNGHIGGVSGIEFSSFNGCRYLCSGSFDTTIRLWDVETSKSLHVFNGHTNAVWCVDFSPLQSNYYNDDNKSNKIGLIGGNGYNICSGSGDKTIRTWDIETAKQLTVFKGHSDFIGRVKYGSNGLGIIGGVNTILSGSGDKSVRLWDTRSGQQIQVFKGHISQIWSVEYLPFAIKNSEVAGPGVICSGSMDNTIRFWDIRSNKNELYIRKGDSGILCLKYIQLKKKGDDKLDCDINLCYGSYRGSIHIWG
ncbi:WD repeat-containing protein [Reticulomyxa filosa]|uniref:WD repeat-containing protein n=1 Tax=Reticulomyxa filosa TaxID=46433 RepID=X6N2Q4_RETFI|nr:WD repeat-containing protein [Reticulomyxa filosa]|eukprot:ETO20014.1 WD repeat-containing protein [Reticulomyxa filosa]